LQNEPNFQKLKIALNPLSETAYEKITSYDDPKNKPKTNPIKPNFQCFCLTQFNKITSKLWTRSLPAFLLAGLPASWFGGAGGFRIYY
jgi:hypothetical protein